MANDEPEAPRKTRLRVYTAWHPLIVTLIDGRKRPLLPKTVEDDPGLDVALHRIRRQRELDEFKLDSRIAARQMRRDGLRQMRLNDDGNDTP